MEDYITVSAKTLDDAITEALVQLGVTSDRLDYIVVEKGSEGFLGIGRKQAVIKARRKQEEKPVSKPRWKKSEEKEERRKPTFDWSKKDYEMKPIYSEEELEEIERAQREEEENDWIHDEIDFDEYDKYYEE